MNRVAREDLNLFLDSAQARIKDAREILSQVKDTPQINDEFTLDDYPGKFSVIRIGNDHPALVCFGTNRDDGIPANNQKSKIGTFRQAVINKDKLAYNHPEFTYLIVRIDAPVNWDV